MKKIEIQPKFLFGNLNITISKLYKPMSGKKIRIDYTNLLLIYQR